MTRALTEAATPFAAPLAALTEKHPQLLKAFGRFSNWVNQIGTLGGGNHFIEVCLDESGRVWVMLHSGSRGIGNAIGHYFIELARRDMERWMIQLPDRDLAYLPEGSEHFDDYVTAVSWAQAYARENREQMMALVLAALARHLPAFSVTERGGQLSSQLRRARAPFRVERLGHPQRCDPGPGRAISASSPAAWARAATSCAARAIPRASVPVPTAPGDG